MEGTVGGEGRGYLDTDCYFLHTAVRHRRSQIQAIGMIVGTRPPCAQKANNSLQELPAPIKGTPLQSREC